MKTNNSAFLILILLFVVSLITAPAFAQQNIDTTQIRYIKFSTNVNASISQIDLNEIKAFVDGENVAYGKPVTVNSTGSDYQTSKVVDADRNTAWRSDSYSNLTNNQYGPTINHPHYITVDLGTAYNIESLRLDINGGGAWTFNYTFDFLVSENATNWSLVAHEDNSRGILTYTDIPIQNVRYIKYACYYSSDRGQVNVEEIQAFSNGVNVAKNKSVSVSSGYGGASAVDGSSASRWSSDRNDHISDSRALTGGVWAIVDLESIHTVDSLTLSYNNNTQFTISTSADGNSWIQIDQRLNDSNNYLYILNRLPKVSSRIVSYGNSTVTCKVEIKSDGGSTVTERGICWSTSENPTISDNKTSDGVGIGHFTATVTDLVLNTIYYIRAYATNATGTKYSTVQKILFGLQVQTDVISDINKTSATSGGYISAVDGIEVTARGVCWNTTPSPTIENDHSADGSDSGDFTSTLINLSSDTKYYARAYATTSSDTLYGEEYSFIYPGKKFIARDGFFSDNIYSENGTYNDKPSYSSQWGSLLYYESGYWLLDGWVTSEESGDPPLYGWWDGTTLELIETPIPKVTYDKDSLIESSANNGSFDDTLIITHDNTNGATFAGADDEDFVETGKAIVGNLPAGLTAKIVRNNSLTLTMSLIGYASEHSSTNDISNVKAMLLPNAFTDGNTITTNGNLMLISLYYNDNQVVTKDDALFDNNIIPFAYTQNSRLIINNLPRNSIVRVYDVTGRILLSKNLSETSTYEIPLKSSGLYVVKIDSNRGNWNYKLINN